MRKLILLTASFVVSCSLSSYGESGIKVDSQIRFTVDRVQDMPPKDAVDFGLTVSNNTATNIPSLRIENVTKHAKFIVNGKVTTTPAEFGGMELATKKEVLAPGETDSYGWRWIFQGGPRPYGDKFTVRWEYLGISSKTFEVDLDSKTVKEVR